MERDRGPSGRLSVSLGKCEVQQSQDGEGVQTPSPYPILLVYWFMSK